MKRIALAAILSLSFLVLAACYNSTSDRTLRGGEIGGALVGVPVDAAQIDVSISFDNFYNRLAPYGTWSNNPRWGEVWHPTRVERGFRPYYNGHWVDTREYGWLWVSEDSWGDIPYHYGRWVFDPRDGWLWIPGYVWGPSWVVWRSGGGHIGWFPMPPGDNYYGDGVYRDNFDNQYGYRDWYGPSFGNKQFLSLWIFVSEDHFRDRDFRNYAVPQRDYGRIILQTRNTTNYVTINNYIVNRSIDESHFQRGTNRRRQPVPASSVIGRNAPATQASIGRQVEQRERREHPMPANIDPSGQRGRGSPNSNVQQPNTNQAPQGFGRERENRGPRSNGFVQPGPQTDHGAAVGLAPPPDRATDMSRQDGRNQTNLNPAEQRGRGSPNANAQQPNANQAPQSPGRRGEDRGANSNGPYKSDPQIDRGASVIDAPPPNGNAAPRGLAERRKRSTAGPATLTTPAVSSGGRANPQTDRGRQSFQSPRTRGTPERTDKAIVQGSRTRPRSQGNVPANGPVIDGQGNMRNNEPRGKTHGDTKNADDENAAD